MQDAEVYDAILHKLTQNSAEIDRAFDIVAQFIRENECILSGGMAVDANLRAKGDYLYPLGSVPDYDPWSPNHIELAEKLAQKLCQAKLSDVTVSNATHLTTRVVGVGPARVCEITYIPVELYRRIPTIRHNGFLVRSAHHQMCDMLYCIGNPLYKYPDEIYKRRTVKDIKRLNKLMVYYPFDVGADDLYALCGGWQEFTVPDEWGAYCVAGLASIVGITHPDALHIKGRTIRYIVPASSKLLILLHDVPPDAVLYRGAYADYVPAVYAISGVHVSEDIMTAGCVRFQDGFVTVGCYELACSLTTLLYEQADKGERYVQYKTAFDTLYRAMQKYGAESGAYGSPLTLSGIIFTEAKDAPNCVGILNNIEQACSGLPLIKYRPDAIKFDDECILPPRADHTPLYSNIDFQLAT